MILQQKQPPTGKNLVDNVEMVFLQNAEAGTYTIYVEHDGSLENDEQAFSIIISGIDEYTYPPQCATTLETPENEGTNVFITQEISWNPVEYASSYDVFFGTDGEGVEIPTSIYNGENVPTNSFFYLMEPSTTYYLHVVPKNNFGEAEGCGTIWSFSTLEAITQYPYLLDMSEVEVPMLPELWHAVDLSDADWKSTNQIGVGDNKSMILFNPGGLIETDYDNWFISPPFSVEVGKEYMLSYYLKNMIFGHEESLTLYWGNTPLPEDLVNILTTHQDMDEVDWIESESMIIPDEDGYVFLGWHAESVAGLGILLDNILVEDYGPVSVINPDIEENPVFAYNGERIILKGGENWDNASLEMTNVLGQTVHVSKFYRNASLDLNESDYSGIYIVTLTKGNARKTWKIVKN